MSRPGLYGFQMRALQIGGEQSKYPSLVKDRVHVFYGMVSGFSQSDALFFLSEKEKVRASHYVSAADQNRYIISRAILKCILAGLLKVQEKDIEFQYSKNGKPWLRNNPALKFSLSHSEDIVVIAVSYGDEVGIDVEQLDREVDLAKLQSYLFTQGELSIFQSISRQFQKKIFIHSWTKKEAFLKATGEGLTRAMNSLELAFSDEVHSQQKKQMPYETDWILDSFTPTDNCVATVAVQGPGKTVTYSCINPSLLTH